MKLTEPLEQGLLHFRTRLVFPPMASQTSVQGVPGPETLAHYRALAANPLVGLLITEHSYIARQGKADPDQLSFAEDGVIPYQQKLTELLHKTSPGLKVFAQLNHAGLNTAEYITGQELVSASSLQTRDGVSRGLTIPEIKVLEQKFVDGARRVKASGYDGVELHAAHGYLFNQFYSPLTNFREDQYGPQNLENRLRFLLETVRAVRQAVGPDFPVAVRLGGSDYRPGGSTLEDAVKAAVLLEQAGIDLLDLSGGFCLFMRQGHSEPGWFQDMSRAVKQRVRLPVILTGGVRTPAQAEQLLQEKAADLIGVGRALLQDPQWGNH